MADDKKGKDKGGGASRIPHPAEPVIVLFVIATLGGALINRIKYYFDTDSALAGTSKTLFEKFLAVAPLLQIISISSSILFIILIVHLSRKISRIKQEEKMKLYPSHETEADDAVVNQIVNKKWLRVEEHARSKNPSDWRLAIIEADILLDELLDALGYRGDSIGDKLKVIEKSDFLTLDSAWEAHKVRNAIAHEGSNFDLNERETARVINLYRAVFEEFKFI